MIGITSSASAISNMLGRYDVPTTLTGAILTPTSIVQNNIIPLNEPVQSVRTTTQTVTVTPTITPTPTPTPIGTTETGFPTDILTPSWIPFAFGIPFPEGFFRGYGGKIRYAKPYNEKFYYISDLASRFWGIYAKPKQVPALLRPGRIFGTETRPMIRR